MLCTSCYVGKELKDGRRIRTDFKFPKIGTCKTNHYIRSK